MKRKESQLQQLCSDRMLPSNMNKCSLIEFLLHDDKVHSVKACMPELAMVIQKHDIATDKRF